MSEQPQQHRGAATHSDHDDLLWELYFVPEGLAMLPARLYASAEEMEAQQAAWRHMWVSGTVVGITLLLALFVVGSVAFR